MDVYDIFKRITDTGFDIGERVEYHKNNATNKSFIKYIREQRMEITKQTNTYYKIYLDTKFWVYFRDIILNKQKNSDIIELYNIIKIKREEGKVICPVSTNNYTELTRQSDIDTKTATAKLMDSFSGGVCYTFYFDKIVNDFFDYLYFLKFNKYQDYDSTFDNISYVLGVPTFDYSGSMDPLIKLAFQKATYDGLKYLNVNDIVQISGENIKSREDEKADLANTTKSMNESKEIYKNNNYNEIYNKEITGIMGFKEYLIKALKYSIIEDKNRYDEEADVINLPNDEAKKILQAIIYGFQNNRMSVKDLPTLNIQVKINAAVYADHNRKFKDNDYDDFRHASIALPSSNFFLTENSLSHLLNTSPTNLAEDYNVKTTADIKEAIKWIKSLS